ncbi:hypothetical protein [Desulfobotulus mexicanus]|uniref:Uncharacterized protein n=1 Tax=Desulfobotulus mexicanus TaxID=2586642 RepID=A0A5S5MBT7_9BACT|nr:hypothetical protein [Desulfobotulus mexicanus]TYT73183.1 hypothetical protein FIM25_16480 [Desulfobotulus mexicanus]
MNEKKLYSFKEIGEELNLNYKKILNYRNQVCDFLPGWFDGKHFKCFHACIEILLLVDGLRGEGYTFQMIKDILLKKHTVKDDPLLSEWVDECLENYSHYWFKWPDSLGDREYVMASVCLRQDELEYAGMNQYKPGGAGMTQDMLVGAGMGQYKPGDTGMNQSKPECTGMDQEELVAAGMNQHEPEGTGMNQDMLGGAGVNQDEPEDASRNQDEPVHAGMNQDEPVGASISRLMPVDASMCQCVPVATSRCQCVPGDDFIHGLNLSYDMNFTLPDTPMSTVKVWDSQPVNSKVLVQEIKNELLKELIPMLESLLQKFATNLGGELSRALTHAFQKLATESNIGITAVCESIGELQHGIRNLDKRMTNLEKELGLPVEEPLQLYEIDASNLQVSLQTLTFDLTVPRIQPEQPEDPVSTAEEDSEEDADPHNLRPVIESIKNSKPDKAVLIEWILLMRSGTDPVPSYNTLAAILNKAKILTLSGKSRWTSSTVRNVVARLETEDGPEVYGEEEEDGLELVDEVDLSEEDDLPSVAGGAVPGTWLDIENGTDEEEP